MYRTCITFLQNWLNATDRKPLVIRGARQTGKTWLVRYFATLTGRQLIELNFEQQRQLASHFSSNDPKQILLNLGAALNLYINPAQTVLFLDEIQAVPELLGKLRWFAEQLPELPVIATGSLLEFVLEEHTFSMPVGRINYMYLEPLSFEEFLLANEKQILHEYLQAFHFGIEIPIVIHTQLMTLFKEYMITGGLPAAASSWAGERVLIKIDQIHNDLLATYRDDFAKYSGKIATSQLDEVMLSVPKMLGQKFIYSHVNPHLPAHKIRTSLELLNKARICHRVVHSAANSVPLAAEMNEKYVKEIFLDTGLCSSALGLSLHRLTSLEEIILINNGQIAEQIVGQLLRTIHPPYIEPRLYYWQREEQGSNAEIDYVIQQGSKVIPIEVKAGTTGTLKSLHLFIGVKKYSLAMRANSDLPNITDVKVTNQKGQLVEYRLISIPFYLIGQINRLIELEFI